MIPEKQHYEVGDVLLYKNRGDVGLKWIFGELIKLTTKGDYVHSAIYLGEHEKLGSIIGESVASGFMLRFHDNLGHKQLRYKDGLSNTYKNRIINQSLTMSGYQYGYLDIPKILLYIITKIDFFPETTKNLTCAEGVARVYDEIYLPIVNRDNLDFVYPSDLARSDKLITL